MGMLVVMVMLVVMFMLVVVVAVVAVIQRPLQHAALPRPRLNPAKTLNHNRQTIKHQSFDLEL